MTNELEALAQVDLSRTPQQVPAPSAVAMLMQHAQAMQAAHQLATALCASDLVPAAYRNKPDNGAAAILYGAEIGLNPIQSLQQVFVVHGNPTIYARTMVALLKSRGYRVWTEHESDDSVTVTGVAPDGTSESATWDLARAKKAGYTSNKKYDTDPRAMLYAKAAAQVCRRLAPEVLLGITYSVEEMELEPIRATATRVDRPNKVTVEDILAVPAPATDPEPPATPMSTLPQQKKLAILLGEAGVTDRAEKLKYLKEQFGRDFTTSKQLTRDEATQLIDFLETSGQPEAPTPPEGE